MQALELSQTLGKMMEACMVERAASDAEFNQCAGECSIPVEISPSRMFSSTLSLSTVRE